MSLSTPQALMVLNALPKIGPITAWQLQRHFQGEPGSIFSAPRQELLRVKGISPQITDVLEQWQEYFDLTKEEKNLKAKGAAFITADQPDYPACLREIHDPPIGLYWLGDYRIERSCIAIVGSRRCTLYGQKIARQLADELAHMGFCVVSGMARGIDTNAHKGALQAEGKTVAIFGCGLDIIYPPENFELYRRILMTGAVVSEFPFGRRPDRWTFPMRNRLISGMCVAVVVVETDKNGGSMLTAHFAGEQGRTVFAIPGRIDQAASRGCHQLIREGATLLSSADEILEELSYLRPLPQTTALDRPETTIRMALPEGLGEAERSVLACFQEGELLTAEAVAQRTQLSPQQVVSTLVLLELKKLIAKRTDATFEARL